MRLKLVELALEGSFVTVIICEDVNGPVGLEINFPAVVAVIMCALVKFTCKSTSRRFRFHFTGCIPGKTAPAMPENHEFGLGYPVRAKKVKFSGTFSNCVCFILT